MRLGVVGGGQLGRFFAASAQRLGHTAIVLDPDPHCPAALVADGHVCADYDDDAGLAAFVDACDAATVEFENLPAPSLERIAAAVPLRPAPAAVTTVADRRTEKRLVTGLGLPLPAFDVLEDTADLERLTAPGGLAHAAVVVKTARLGYDGKGQVRLDAPAGPDTARTALAAAWDALGRVPCTVEHLVPLERELSIVLARDVEGATVAFSPTVNVHVDGILDTSVVAPDDALTAAARTAAVRIAHGIDHVGVLAVECFVVGGELLINEVAPRPHNSGHWTLDGATSSQFDLQAHVLTGAPLAALPPDALAPTRAGIAMANLLGDLWAAGEPRFELVDDVPGATLHLYGKRDARPGRKMGHLTVLRDDASEALEVVRLLRERLVEG
ncbi:MAG: phosphoribosylaminoimidazole carboxylase [Actinomycetota bacterium]